jgi:porin
MDGGDAFDISSLYFVQAFGNGASVAFGKINMIDMVAGKPFMGGAGIDSFWNHTITATPTGTVPPYLLGVLASVPTDAATYRCGSDLHDYEPVRVRRRVRRRVSIRGQVDFA